MRPIPSLLSIPAILALGLLLAGTPAVSGAAPAVGGAFPANPTDSGYVPPVPALPYVSRIYVEPAQPCAGRPTSIVVEGTFPDDCGMAYPDSSGLGVLILAHPPSGVPCAMVIKPWRVTLPLGRLAAGTHRANLRLQVLDNPYQGVYATSLTWQVAASCDSAPALPFVERVLIGTSSPADPTGALRVCADAGFPVRVEGHFPDACWDLQRLELRTVECFAPCPPVVRVVVRRTGAGACATLWKPFSGEVRLGGLPAGNQSLVVELVEEYASADSGVVQPVALLAGAASFPFVVQAGCDSTVPPPNPLPFVAHVLIGTPSPADPEALRVCAGQRYPVAIDGYFPDGCWNLERVEMQGIACFTTPCLPLVRVVVRHTGGGACPTYMKPFSGTVTLPGLEAGDYSQTVEVVQLAADGSQIGQPAVAGFPFRVEAACDSVLPPALPFVEHVTIGTPSQQVPGLTHLCPDQSFPVYLDGHFPDGCWNLERVELVMLRCPAPRCLLPVVRVVARHSGARACPDIWVPWSGVVTLPGVPKGDYGLSVQVSAIGPDGSPIDRYSGSGSFPFRVPQLCDSMEPPPGPLPYVTQVQVGDPGPSGEVCIAAGDSIPVTVSATLPLCHFVRRVELLPSQSMQPSPQPPILRILVDDGACLDRIRCDPQTAWSARVMLPGLLARGYQLITQVARVSCSDSVLPENLFSAAFPFTVAQACSASACLSGGWVHPNTAEACDAHAAPGRRVTADFTVRSPVALSGLQGVLTVSPAGMLVMGLEAIGPAAGMHVDWTRGTDGTHFVMYSGHGAPIPATPWAAAVQPPAVLRVTLYPDTDLVGVAATSRVMGLFAGQLLGSDSVGTGVSECPPPMLKRYDPFYNAFRICTEDPCDFNADGRSDVRDLVLMVRCINGVGPCALAADSLGVAHDCDHSGAFDLDDVVCCARSMLRDTGCPDCVPGDSSGTRPEPTVRVALDPPARTVAGADVSVHVSGASRLGAVSLALSYPFERYDVTGVDFPGDAGGWLHLFQVQDGRVRIALIGGGPTALDTSARDRTLDAVIHLALKPGSEPGGQVGVAGGQFSGPDGAGLQVDLGSPSQWLAPARLVLSGNRPNPFAADTRFSLDLDQASDVEVAIFDVTGRRVATVFRGRLSQGTREFQWNGRTEAGAPASSGIYFSRVTSLGRLVSRKMLLVRGS
jgi:hypothetical protein